jgi:hypothetical protein
MCEVNDRDVWLGSSKQVKEHPNSRKERDILE